MSNENEQSRKSDSPDGHFAEQLKRQAAADRPSFCVDLHDRVMANIVASGRLHAAKPLVTLVKKGSLRRRAIQWPAIAAAMLIAIIAIDQFRRGGGNSTIGVPPHPDVAQVQPSTRTEVSFDDLDHTAGIALRLVVDQLPIEVPADDWGLPKVN
jgi:hypothetical protein